MDFIQEDCREIGKLENGKPDPCYTCANCDSPICQECTDYDKSVKNKQEA